MVGRQRKRGRERISIRLCTLSAEPDAGLISQTVRSWPEPKSRVGRWAHWATQAPLQVNFLLGRSCFKKLFLRNCLKKLRITCRSCQIRELISFVSLRDVTQDMKQETRVSMCWVGIYFLVRLLPLAMSRASTVIYEESRKSVLLYPRILKVSGVSICSLTVAWCLTLPSSSSVDMLPELLCSIRSI